jgi:alpha-ketoglutarate-dependent taurine dioxygenase
MLTNQIISAPRVRRLWMEELVDIIAQPERVYAHKWAAGDVVLWDNNSMIHTATQFPPEQTRVMLRSAALNEVMY